MTTLAVTPARMIVTGGEVSFNPLPVTPASIVLRGQEVNLLFLSGSGRAISNTFRNALQASASGEVVLIFVTIEHENLVRPYRVVSEGERGYSRRNGRICNYYLHGELYLGCPFGLDLVSDTDRAPEARAEVPNVDRELGEAIRALRSPARFKIEVVKESEYAAGVDAANGRSPTGTPHIEYRASHLYLREVSGDVIAIRGRLGPRDLSTSPYPRHRASQTEFPAIYR